MNELRARDTAEAGLELYQNKLRAVAERLDSQ